MARKPRIEYEGALYHVRSRGDRGELTSDASEEAYAEAAEREHGEREADQLIGRGLMKLQLKETVRRPSWNCGRRVIRASVCWPGYVNLMTSVSQR